MTKQTEFANSLVGSQAGFRITRLRALTIASILAIASVGGFGQQPRPVQSEPAKPATEKKPASEPKEKMLGNYTAHSSVELGGVITQKDGSRAMWSTMVNERTGLRVLNQSLELRSVNTRKTPFFDTLSTASFGYGGEPNDVSYLKISKGKLYDFSGNFRRDRNYFDYNLLANSLLSTATAANPALVPEPDSLHLFNTVRRNTDALFTLFPISRVSFRVGYIHNTNEGPTYSSVHNGGDVQVSQWFRNALDTYTGGVDLKIAKRTTLSYDQFFALYRGDSTFQLAPTPFKLANGTPTSLGVDTLSGTTCGTGSNKTLEVVNGIANPYCSQTLVQSQVAPQRTTFPTEQFRFSSHYWDRVSFNGRVAYSGDTMNVNNFNETFNGLLTRTFLRQEIDTGGLGNGRLAHNKRDSLNADFGVEAELSKNLAVSDVFTYRNFRVEGNNSVVSQVWAGTSSTPNLNVNTPLASLTPVTTTTPNNYFLNQKIAGNTVLGSLTVVPEFKLSAGWRFDNRNIVDPGDDLTWHQNGLLLGAVITPSHAFLFNVNYDTLNWKSANADTPSNTYTREALDKVYHLRLRASAKPAKWINFAVTANEFDGKNNDPLVNHVEHSHDVSFATQVIPSDRFSFDLNYAHDDVFSTTDLCYIYVPTTAYPLPPGAQGSVGTCLQTADNPGGTLPTQSAGTQLYLGGGRYDAPVNFFSGAVSWAPSKYFRYNGGARITDTNGTAEFLNPLMVPGAQQSKVLSPFSDLQVNIAPQWAWHGNWVHHGYDESGGPGPAPRSFHGDVVTLGVKYAF
jgi:hypothetical protein